MLVLFEKASGWWGPAHGGTHVARSALDHEGGSPGRDDFLVTYSRKGRETRFDADARLFSWIGAAVHPIYADTVRLQEKHPEYFASQSDVELHIQRVLSRPVAAMPATEERFTLMIAPADSEEDRRTAVVEFAIRGGKYRVRNAQMMSAFQASMKVERAEGEGVLRRRGRNTTGPARRAETARISDQGPDAGLSSRPPTKLTKSIAQHQGTGNMILFFKAKMRGDDRTSDLFGGSEAPGMTRVKGHVRKDGAFVAEHNRKTRGAKRKGPSVPKPKAVQENPQLGMVLDQGPVNAEKPKAPEPKADPNLYAEAWAALPSRTKREIVENYDTLEYGNAGLRLRSGKLNAKGLRIAESSWDDLPGGVRENRLALLHVARGAKAIAKRAQFEREQNSYSNTGGDLLKQSQKTSEPKAPSKAETPKAPEPKAAPKPRKKKAAPGTHRRVVVSSPLGRFDVYVKADKDATDADYEKDARNAFLTASGGGSGLAAVAQTKVISIDAESSNPPEGSKPERNIDWAHIVKQEKASPKPATPEPKAEPWEMTQRDYVKAQSLEPDARDKAFEKAIARKSVEKRGPGLFYVPDKVATPEFRKRLQSEQDATRGSARPSRTNRFEFVEWADVTGNPQDRGYAIRDLGERNDARSLDYHKRQVQQAIADGKPVPADVLADYPGLAAPKPATSKPEAKGAGADEKPKDGGARESERQLAEKKSVEPFDAAYQGHGQITVRPREKPRLGYGHELVDVAFYRLKKVIPKKTASLYGRSPTADFYRYGVAKNEDGKLYAFMEYPKSYEHSGGDLYLDFEDMGDFSGISEFYGLQAAARKMFDRHSGNAGSGGDLFKSRPLYLIFAKAEIANRPGMILVPMTDRSGRKSARWRKLKLPKATRKDTATEDMFNPQMSGDLHDPAAVRAMVRAIGKPKAAKAPKRDMGPAPEQSAMDFDAPKVSSSAKVSDSGVGDGAGAKSGASLMEKRVIYSDASRTLTQSGVILEIKNKGGSARFDLTRATLAETLPGNIVAAVKAAGQDPAGWYLLKQGSSTAAFPPVTRKAVDAAIVDAKAVAAAQDAERNSPSAKALRTALSLANRAEAMRDNPGEYFRLKAKAEEAMRAWESSYPAEAASRKRAMSDARADDLERKAADALHFSADGSLDEAARRAAYDRLIADAARERESGRENG